MTLSPELLLATAADRLRAARPELAARLDLSTLEGLRGARDALADRATPAGEALVVTVVGRLHLPDWVRETCRFALSLPAERAEPWRRAFTRTVYLAGRPANLADRFAFDHVAKDGSVAWLGPAPDQQSAALRRLLKVFDGTRPFPAWAPVTVAVPGSPAGGGARRPVHRDLYIATAGVTVSRLLVHVNHLLAEAVLDELIAPGDELTLRCVPHLAGLAVPFAALRVDTDPRSPHLRAYAGLTEETRR